MVFQLFLDCAINNQINWKYYRQVRNIFNLLIVSKIALWCELSNILNEFLFILCEVDRNRTPEMFSTGKPAINEEI